VGEMNKGEKVPASPAHLIIHSGVSPPDPYNYDDDMMMVMVTYSLPCSNLAINKCNNNRDSRL